MLCLFCKAQFPVHDIRNYTTSEYDAFNQNWAIAEDSLGVLYFGNSPSTGVLRYDGETWSKIEIDKTIIKSLASDSKGNIYVGSQGSFGQLVSNKNGVIGFKAFSNDSLKLAKECSNIIPVDTGVYFFGEREIFFYHSDDSSIEKVKNLADISFMRPNQAEAGIFYNNRTHGLIQLNGNKVDLGPYAEKSTGQTCFYLTAFRKGFLLASLRDGLFYFNCFEEDSSQIEMMPLALSEHPFFQDNIIFGGLTLRNGNMIISSLQKGAILINKDLEVLKYFNKATGLQDNFIIKTYEDSKGNLWFALNNGISKFDLNLDREIYRDESGFVSGVEAIYEMDGRIYLSTPSGYSYLNPDTNILHFETPPEQFINDDILNAQGFNFIEIEGQLLLSSTEGIFQVNQSKTVNTSHLACRGFVKIDDHLLLCYGSNGFFSMTFQEGSWEVSPMLPDLVFSFYNAILFPRNDEIIEIWANTFSEGTHRILLDQNLKIQSHEVLGEKEGLPKGTLFLHFIDNHILMGTKEGLKEWNGEQFVPSDFLGPIFKASKDVFKIFPIDSNYWVISDDSVLIVPQAHKQLVMPFPAAEISQIQCVYKGKNSIWLGGSDGVIKVDRKRFAYIHDDYNCLISEVYNGVDSLMYGGGALSQSKQILPFVSNTMSFRFGAAFYDTEEKTVYQYKLVGFDQDWSTWSTVNYKEYSYLNEGDYTFQVRAKNVFGKVSSIASYSFTILPPWYRTTWAYFGYVVLFVLVVALSIRLYSIRLIQTKKLLEQKVSERTKALSEAKSELEEKNNDITSSIRYAKRIQSALFPSEEIIDNHFTDHFILFQPKDIVSGDFYWASEKNDQLYLAAADCTGHGVPGAIMSVLCISHLNQNLIRPEINSPADLLNAVNDSISNELMKEKAGEENINDGMDIALCAYDKKEGKISYSGAFNSLYLIRESQLTEYKASKSSVGVFTHQNKLKFENNEIEVQSGDMIYLFSDGFADQFGGDKGKKLKRKKFKELLIEYHQMPGSNQKKLLLDYFNEWMFDYDQVDDVVVIGIRV